MQAERELRLEVAAAQARADAATALVRRTRAAASVAGTVLAEKPADAVMRHQHAGALLMAGMGYRVSGQANEAADYLRRYKEEADALASPR